MERILTFAEFAKSFDQKGTELGNTPADVDALAASTDQFTAGADKECPETPEMVDGGGEKVVDLVVDTPEEEEVENDFSEEEPEELGSEEGSEENSFDEETE
jgi:predicted transcriptional regulator